MCVCEREIGKVDNFLVVNQKKPQGISYSLILSTVVCIYTMKIMRREKQKEKGKIMLEAIDNGS